MIMSLNSSYLDAFYCCAQLRHFTKAAQRLHITQSALSQRIKNLEEELGITLIIRERSGLRLTEMGEHLLRYCQTKNNIENEILESIKGGVSDSLKGIVSIGGFSSIIRSVVLPSLSQILRENPGIQIKFVTKELYELKPLLKSGEIDFMINDEELKHEGLLSHILGYERNVQIQKRGYKGTNVYLDHDEEDLITAKYFKKKTTFGLKRHYFDDIYGIIDGVRLGVGKAIVPIHLISKISDIEILDSDRIISTPVVLHYYEQPFYSKIHQSVVKGLLENCPLFLK
jgi:DNA-binding transcriptional LysR family regulator